jgi:hypothetical protein
MKQVKKMKKIFLLAALAMCAGSCVIDVEENKPAAAIDNEGRLVTLSLAVPGAPASRGLSCTEENAVIDVDVLLFDASDHFYYRAVGSNIAQDGELSSRQKFTVKLPEGPWKAVVLANARAILANSPHATRLSPSALPGEEDTPVARATILDALVQQLTGTANKWTEENFRGIPMWGYCDLAINATTSTPAANLDLTRAIARVDVSVKDDEKDDEDPDALWNKFSLASVRLYNYSRAGSLAPKAGEITVKGGYLASQWNGSEAIAPNLPIATVEDLKVLGPPLVYNVPCEQKHAYKQEIYTFEADAGDKETLATNTCLVIGGYYKASEKSAPVLTYYRVEFARKNGEKYDYLPLLRNHNYDVEIQDVTGEGYPTPEGAFDNKPSNIVVGVVDWNDGGLNETDFTGQHYLSVDKSELVFYAEGGEKSLKVLTNFPDGWTVDASPLPVWCDVDANATGAVNVQAALALTAETLQDANERGGYFYIVAGNFKKKIFVRQVAEEEFSLELSPWELTFYKTVTSAKTVTLSPVPAPADISAYTLGAAGEIAWKTGYDPAVSANKATLLDNNILSLWPATNDGETTRTSSVMVILKGTDGRTVSRTVNVKQFARDPSFEASISNPYPASGGEYTFNVVSDWSWSLAKSNDPANILTLADGSMHLANPDAPHPYTFSLTPYTGYTSTPRSEKINVISNDPDFPEDKKTITIEQATTPYLVIIDPESKAHEFTTGDPRIVTFRTNAGWLFTTGAGFADVILNTSITTGELQQGSPSPSTEVVETVTFTPKVSTAAGLSTTTVVFTTKNPDGATEASETVTLRRFVDKIWNFVSSNPGENMEIIAKATSVTLYANTNLKWWGQATDNTANTVGAKEESATPTAYKANDMLTVTIPERPVDNADSWTESGTITVRAGHDALPGIPALDPVHEFTLNRPAYTITVTPSDETFSSVKLAVTMDAPGFRLRFRLKETSVNIGNILSGSENKIYSVNLPENNITKRTVNIINDYTGEVIGEFEQPAFPPVYYYPNATYTSSSGWNLPIGFQLTARPGYVRIYGTDTPLANGTYNIVTSVAGNPNKYFKASLKIVDGAGTLSINGTSENLPSTLTAHVLIVETALIP